MNKKIIVLKDVHKKYSFGGAPVEVLKGINLEVNEAEIVAIWGPSGSGKSTLLNIIGTLSEPTAGEVYFDGANVTNLSEKELTDYRRKRIGFVFQSFNLIPNLSALENIMLPMEYAGVKSQEAKKRATELLELVKMSHRSSYRPNKLSGGEQQRVAIARAMANNPALLLADEPTGNLDTTTGREIVFLLKQLTKQERKTLIIATHNEEIVKISDAQFSLIEGKLTRESNSSLK